MKPTQLQSVLAKSIAAKIPILITGAPGIGKTEIIQAACDEAGADLLPVFASMSDPTEPKGLPSKAQITMGQGTKRGKHLVNIAEFLPYGALRRMKEATRPLVVFLDDFGQSTQAVQASWMQPLGAHVDGNGEKLSEHVTFIAATNRREDRAGVSGLLEPVKSRFTSIINLEVDVEAWIAWALKNDVPIELIAFIKYRPALLHAFEVSNDMVNTPSPRTVYRLGTLLKLGLPPEVELDTYTGAVGSAFAAEFMGFLSIFRELPNPDSIITNPDKVKVPTGKHAPSVSYAICGAVARKTSDTNIDRIMRYIVRLPKEFQVLYIKDIDENVPGIQNTRAFIEWHSENSDLMI